MAFAVEWQVTHEKPLPEEKIIAVFQDTIFKSLNV